MMKEEATLYDQILIKDADGNFKYEKPIYVNQRYPWQNYENVSLGANVTAPTVNNSVGQYKRTFTVPSDWDGRDVFVSFEGVESAFYLYVNGQRVGYGEDSYTTDEFNITSYLKKGENTIAVEVYRWSTGSYLENQDFIRMSGIFRDVNLYSKAKVEMRDLFVKTDLDKNYKDATLTLDADIRNLGDDTAAGKKYTVSADLYKIDGKTHTGSFTLQRYKGLGEMDAEQLWETTLDPETRMLKKVEIEDGRMASDVTEMLMGTDVPPRKAFIYEHANDAELDI